ncbi:hypothetical protein ACLMJK_006772 [Lecanora helva]
MLSKRQGVDYGNDDDGDDGGYWGYSDTAIAIKWAFIGLIVLLFLIWFIGGYIHAQRRVRAGKRPLAYHRFLLPSRQRMQYMQRQPHGYYTQPHGYGEAYPMHPYGPPPPAYHADHIPPPVYQPPQGGSKVNPAQEWDVPPPGPPPGHANGAEPSDAMESVPLGPASGSHSPVTEEPPLPAKKSGRLSRLNPFK